MGTMPRWDFGPSGGGGGNITAGGGVMGDTAAGAAAAATGANALNWISSSGGGAKAAAGEWDFGTAPAPEEAAPLAIHDNGASLSTDPSLSHSVPVDPPPPSAPNLDEAPASWLNMPPAAPPPVSTASVFSKTLATRSVGAPLAAPLGTAVLPSPAAALGGPPPTTGSLGKSAGASVAKTLMAAVAGHLPFVRQTPPPTAPPTNPTSMMSSGSARSLAQQQQQQQALGTGTMSSATARATAAGLSAMSGAATTSGRPASLASTGMGPLMISRPKLTAVADAMAGGPRSRPVSETNVGVGGGLQPRPPPSGPVSANGVPPLVTTAQYLAASRQQQGGPTRGAPVNDRWEGWWMGGGDLELL